MKNQRGQGSSVFQLLISAVVALAILGVLLGIIGGLPNLGGQNPITAAQNALKDAYTSIGSPHISSKVSVNKDVHFTYRGVTPRDLGVNIDRVCIGVADSLDDSFGGDQGVSQTTLTYTGTGSRDVKIGALCETGADIEKASQDVFGDLGSFESDKCSKSDSTEIYCLIAILPV